VAIRSTATVQLDPVRQQPDAVSGEKENNVAIYKASGRPRFHRQHLVLFQVADPVIRERETVALASFVARRMRRIEGGGTDVFSPSRAEGS